MAQTAYTVDPAVGFRGLLADPNGDAYAIPMANGAAAAQGFGIMVKRDAVNLRDQFDIFSAAGQTPLGVLIHTHEQQDPDLAGSLGISLLEIASVLRRGRIWVRVEEAITVGDSVYFRHTTGSGTEIGAFRNDADGVAEVTTCTPTVVEDDIYGLDIQAGGVPFHFEAVADGDVGAAQVTTATPTIVEDDIYGLDFKIAGVPYHFEAVADGSAGAAQVTTLTPTVTNTADYGVDVLVDHHLYNFQYTSDGSAADTEIVAGIAAAMAGNAEFTALVVATGTTTLILTGQNAGQRLDVIDSGSTGVWTSVTETTPPGISTATLLCDKFRALMAADIPFTASVVATGTATLILTGQALGQLIYVIDSGHGPWASITETVPAGVATATTLLNKFRALMAADAPFTALVVATGTATLILTSQVAGTDFRVIDAGHGPWASITEGVASAPTCDQILNAQWLEGSTAAGVALLEVNIP